MTTNTATTNVNATVDTPCQEYNDNRLKWVLIDDALAGSSRIKEKTTTYLPNPDPSDNSDEGKHRYSSYLKRAVWYGATAQTSESLVGMVFSKPTDYRVPELLQPLVNNVDGQGLSIDQFSKKVLSNVLPFGRAGILVDYPKTENVVTRADVLNGEIRPRFSFYDKLDIINWRTKEKGSSVFLSLVVLKENHATTQEGGFGQNVESQYRVLSIDEEGGFYKMQLWRKSEAAVFSIVEEVVPVDASGKSFTQIPFIFVGSRNNDPTVDKPPLLDLAQINIHHYVNSADYEEAVHIMGQPQLVFTGITKDWIEDVWKSKGVRFGSRVAISLPKEAACELLQVQPNMLAKEAMEQKERQMSSLGASIVEQRQVQQTATEAGFNESAKTSILSAAADNVSDAITKCLEWAGMFVGELQGEEKTEQGITVRRIKFDLSTDFSNTRMNAQDRAQLLSEYNGKVISYTELRNNLKTAGVAFQEDEDAKSEIDSDPNFLVTEIASQVFGEQTEE